MQGLKVEVKYNSYLDGHELGDLTCSEFGSFVEFCEHVVACKSLVAMQLKHDPQYFDVHEARIDVWVNGERQSTIHFKRDAQEWQKVIAYSNHKILTDV